MRKFKSKVGWLVLGVIALFPALAPAPQELVRPKVGELKDLADARAKTCERMLDFYRESLKAPPAPGDPLKGPAERYMAGYEPIQVWSKRLLEARLDGSADVERRVRVLTEEVERMKKFEVELPRFAQGEPEWRIVIDSAVFYRLEVEYRLAKEKASR